MTVCKLWQRTHDSFWYLTQLYRKTSLPDLNGEPYYPGFPDDESPELDGNDATMEIRRREGEGSISKTPIIGLTAGAMKEEREKSLAVGMDDFITKPIDIEKLRGIVLAYLDSDTVEHFDKQEFIEAVEDRELITDMLCTAKAEIPQRIDSMGTALDANDYAEAAALAHRVKGTALVLRCNRLAEAAVRMVWA